MTGERFLEACDELGLKVWFSLDAGLISIEAPNEEGRLARKARKAQRKLANNKELNAEVTTILRERAAQEQGQAAPVKERPRPAEAEHESGGLELDGVTACLKALQSLTDAQKSKLRGFITACRARGLKLIADSKRRVYLERLDGQPIEGDISDLFTGIYGWSECAALVFIGTQDRAIAEELNMTAAQAECDLFTAAYLIARMRRDLYLATCEDWNFKPIEAGIERLKTRCEELKILYWPGYDEDGKPRVFFATREVTSVDDMVDFQTRLPTNPALERAFYNYICGDCPTQSPLMTW